MTGPPKPHVTKLSAGFKSHMAFNSDQLRKILKSDHTVTVIWRIQGAQALFLPPQPPGLEKENKQIGIFETNTEEKETDGNYTERWS